MDIETVKAANRIEDVVAESLTTTGTRRYRRTKEHDSLVIDTVEQSYFWNSRGEQGDVVDWAQERNGWDFKEAVEWLCRRAHLELPRWTAANTRVAVARRKAEDVLTLAGRYFIELYRASEEAQAYSKERGWAEEICREAGIGFYDGDVKGLRDYLRMCDANPAAEVSRALLAMPGGMLIYPHVRAKRVRYLSGRSIEGKRHYNLRGDLVGERKPYFNHLYARNAAGVVVCEGQADAVTWAQWGTPAVALAGCSPDVELVRELSGLQVYLALDQDEAGGEGTRAMADLVGPMCRVLPPWPEGAGGRTCEDANEALLLGIKAKATREMLERALTWVEIRASSVGMAPQAEREELLREGFALVRRLDEFQQATMRKDLANRMGIGVREFNSLLKAVSDVEEREERERDALMVEERVIGGWFDEHLVESIYTPEEERTRLAVRFPNGQLGEVEDLVLTGRRLLPISPFHPALKKSVLLPDGIGEYDSVKALQREVAAFLHRYLDVDPFYENLAAYYVLFTWMYDAFQVLPYLRALGDYGTGKTRFLLAIGAICFRPIFVAGATTTSPIFRMLNQFKGTLVLDEADFAASDATTDIIKILNVGYARDFDVQRSAKRGDGDFEVEFFEVFGPKVIATRKKWEDRALESRCLTKEMGGVFVRKEIPVILPLAFREQARKLRNKLLRYRLEHWRPAVEVGNEDVDRSIEPRLNQVTMSLKKMVADPGLVAEIDRFIREYQRQSIADRGMTLAAKVLQALVDAHDQPTWIDPVSDERTFDLSVNAIQQRTNAILDEENEPEEDEEDDGKRRKYELGVKRVGNIIRNELHLKTERDHSKQMRGRFVVVWEEERIEAMCARYGVEQ
jgi:DNA primase